MGRVDNVVSYHMSLTFRRGSGANIIGDIFASFPGVLHFIM